MQVKFAYDHTSYEGAKIDWCIGISDLVKKAITDWKKFREAYCANQRQHHWQKVHIPNDGSVTVSKSSGIYLIGGRKSIYHALKSYPLNQTKFLAPHGTALGFVTARKTATFSKNITVVEIMATRAGDFNSGMWGFDAKRFTDPAFGLESSPNLWLEVLGTQIGDAVWNYFDLK